MSDSMAVEDCDVLSDVLAFLDSMDSMDEAHTDLDSTLSTPSSDSGAPSSGNSPSAAVAPPPTTSKRSNSSRSHAQKLNSELPRPRRLDRYWTKKHEMNKLRGEVEYLGNKLELLRQCALSPGEVRVTSELGVTIRKVCHRRVASLKRLAAHEQRMRERAEGTNAKLRELLQYQRQWSNRLGTDIVQATGVLAKIPQLSVDYHAVTSRRQPSVRKPTSKMHDATWGEVLLQLYHEAVAFATGGFVARLETIDWANCKEPGLRSKPLLEWTTSFPIPSADPMSAGVMWWQAAHQRKAVHAMCESSGGVHEEIVPRIEKACKWSIQDEATDRELQVASITVLENRQFDGLWVMTSTSTAYNASGTAVLYRTASSIVITRAAGFDTQSCVVRANYRIHAPSQLLTPGGRLGDTSEYGTGFDADDAKLAINNVVTVIRAKDHEVQHQFFHETETEAEAVGRA